MKKKMNLRVVIMMMAVSVMTACYGRKETASSNQKPAETRAVQKTPKNNTLTAEEKAEGWVLMFDGKTSKGWRGFKKDHFPKNWEVVDGTLHMKRIDSMTKKEKADRADIIYDKQFENFSLRLEWKIAKNGNSGIFYLGQEVDEFGEIWRTAPEMQVLDNARHPDADKGRDGNRKAGSLYDLIPAKPQNAKPAGEWNQAEITVNNREVTHKQNGEVVVQYKLDTPEWEALIARSKFPALNPNWHKVPAKGYIGLQDHSDDVWYRNLRIKEL